MLTITIKRTAEMEIYFFKYRINLFIFTKFVST